MTNYLYFKELQEKWRLLWTDFQVNFTSQEQLFQELLTCYSQRNRYYHNLTHIYRMLNKIESIKSLAINLKSIQFAVWFHDCIYDTTKKDNEEKSADFAVKRLTDLGLDQTLINRVNELILKTKNHDTLINDIDGQILLDVDLEILGSSTREYYNYAVAIRQEYAWVLPEIYIKKRKQILESFLSKEKIYQTDFFFKELEKQARFNIQQEIINLSN